MHQHEFFVPEEKVFGKTIQQRKEKEYLNLDLSELQLPNVIISGFPYDQGTRRNGGRIGGAVAPVQFRQTLSQIQLYSHKKLSVFDIGDIQSDLQLEVAHQLLLEKHTTVLSRQSPKTLLFCIGGSNDQSYPNAAALLHSYPKQKIAVINIDSHFDVRPLREGKAHSGSPFRLLLEDKHFIYSGSIFVQFGVKGAATSKAHYDYLQGKQVEVIWMEKHIRRLSIDPKSTYQTQGGQMFETLLCQLSSKVDQIFVSFDVDAISSKWMPGVSAPSVIGGLTSDQASEIMQQAGRCKKVHLVDCSQFNPAVESFLSSHFLAELFYVLCMTFAERFQ